MMVMGEKKPSDDMKRKLFDLVMVEAFSKILIPLEIIPTRKKRRNYVHLHAK